ncbi:hypothetical protein GCM10009107_55230 [Ideonella azotifigens]|uniref:Uncharacterized protein n=1 Tax=Ideonella azotifigens TaxID=513160 RepID=A0ABN1KHD3_9BURK
MTPHETGGSHASRIHLDPAGSRCASGDGASLEATMIWLILVGLCMLCVLLGVFRLVVIVLTLD